LDCIISFLLFFLFCNLLNATTIAGKYRAFRRRNDDIRSSGAIPYLARCLYVASAATAGIFTPPETLLFLLIYNPDHIFANSVHSVVTAYIRFWFSKLWDYLKKEEHNLRIRSRQILSPAGKAIEQTFKHAAVGKGQTISTTKEGKQKNRYATRPRFLDRMTQSLHADRLYKVRLFGVLPGLSSKSYRHRFDQHPWWMINNLWGNSKADSKIKKNKQKYGSLPHGYQNSFLPAGPTAILFYNDHLLLFGFDSSDSNQALFTPNNNGPQQQGNGNCPFGLEVLKGHAKRENAVCEPQKKPHWVVIDSSAPSRFL